MSPDSTQSESLQSSHTGEKITLALLGNLPSTSPDGTVFDVESDGTIIIYKSDGTIRYGRKSANSTIDIITTKTPDSSNITQTPDGVINIKFADGTMIVQLPNGSLRIKTPGGNTLIKLADGTITKQSSDGILTVRKPDGTVTVLTPGNAITATPTGTINVKAQDDAVTNNIPDFNDSVNEIVGDFVERSERQGKRPNFRILLAITVSVGFNLLLAAGFMDSLRICIILIITGCVFWIATIILIWKRIRRLP